MLWDPVAYFHGYLQISNEFKDEVEQKPGISSGVKSEICWVVANLSRKET